MREPERQDKRGLETLYQGGRESGEIGNELFRNTKSTQRRELLRKGAGREWEYKVREAGNSDPPVPSPPPPPTHTHTHTHTLPLYRSS